MKTKKPILIALAISLTGILANAQNIISQENLIVYYPFNDDFNDKSGNNYNGRVNGAVLTGAINKACFFDGFNDNIEIPGVEPLDTVKQLTVSCWINPMKADRYVTWISKANENNHNSQWRLSFGPDAHNEVSFVFHNGQWNDYDFHFQFEMNRWYHVLYLIDNMNHAASIYIDGKNIKTFDIGKISISRGSLLIGCQNENRFFFQGMIDEALIYNRLLKESEMQNLYSHFKNSDKAETDSVLVASVKRLEGIHDAAAINDLNKVREIIEADPSLLELKDRDGRTPLLKACRGTGGISITQVEVANYLIDKGANIHAKDKWGLTALMYITTSSQDQKYYDILKRLISMGADVNASMTNRNWTLILSAIYHLNFKVTKLLIDHGADVNIKDIQGTPLHGLIYGYQSNSNSNINDQKLKMAKLLIESGAKFQEFSYGNTELHLAAIRGFSDLVPVLVKHGADIDAVNDYGHTPLFYAARHGHRKATETLIDLGADESVIVETNYSKTPQLSKPLKEGEAYLWFLDTETSPHTGYAVKTRNHLLIFDPPTIDELNEASMANGGLNPKELADQNITILSSCQVYLPDISKMADAISGVNFVLNVQPTTDENNTEMPLYLLAEANKSYSVNNIKIHTIPTASRLFGQKGLGYLVEADGLKVFHAGLHASGNRDTQLENYYKEIDFLKSYGPIDIAILPIKCPHLSITYEPYLYLIDKLAPKAIYLIGEVLVTEEHKKCIEVLKARDVQVFYPDGGIAVGQRFHFLRD